MLNHIKYGIYIISLFIISGNSFSQDSFPGCNDLSAADFQFQTVFQKQPTDGSIPANADLNEPIQMDFDPIFNGNQVEAVDVYIAERKGKVKRFDGINKSVSDIGTLDVRTNSDQGINGIALHPDFKNNRWIFLYYTRNTTEPRKRFRLSRFTLKADKTMDMTTEKILFEMQGGWRDDWHHGGPMAFDRHGDLWLTMGNDSPDHNNGGVGTHVSNDSTMSDQWGAGNTASLRGSILRIHPDNSQKGYSIPKGNFGEYWADQFQSQGNSALATEYRNPTKVLPELYTKGHRSNYSITTHPTKNWIAFGEVNPASADDEFHLVKNPLFAGYPYFYGNNKQTSGHTVAANNIVNNSTIHSGVKNLPPAIPGTINNIARVGITGPIYVYDSTLQSDIKFPPHFTDYWFNFDFNTQKMWATKVNADGSVGPNDEISAAGKLLDEAVIINPIDAHFGPDGALYILNYAGWFSSSPNTGLTRIEYTGNCSPIKTPVLNSVSNLPLANITLKRVQILTAGFHRLILTDVKGQKIYENISNGKKVYNWDDLKHSGIFWVQIVTEQGIVKKKMVLLK